MSSILSRRITFSFYCVLIHAIFSIKVASQIINSESAGIVEVRINNGEKSYQLIVPPDGSLAHKDLLSNSREALDIKNAEIHSDTNARCFFRRKDSPDFIEDTTLENGFVSTSFSTEDPPRLLEDDGTYFLGYRNASRLYCYDTSRDNIEMNDTFTVFLENDIGSKLLRLRLKANAYYTVTNLIAMNLTIQLRKFALIDSPKQLRKYESSSYCYVLWDHYKMDERKRPKQKVFSDINPIVFEIPISLDGIICFRGTNDPGTALKILELFEQGLGVVLNGDKIRER